MPGPHHRAASAQAASPKGKQMSGLKIVAVILVVAGALALIYGGFTYTQNTHEAKLGPIELSVKEKQTVNVPVWAGLGVLLVGVALLVTRK
jgi:TRAP-type C4-dicarboxylate transport system permease small subunit